MKMKLYTEKGNLNTLKLLAAAEESGIKLEVVEKKHGGVLDRCTCTLLRNDQFLKFVKETCPEKVIPYLTANVLPVLEVYLGKFLFSPNSATRYISNKKSEETDADVDKWLEWESSQLQPVLYPYLVSVIGLGKPETGLLIHIQTLLKSLNGELKGKKFLSEIGLSAADFVLWGSLYPLLAGKFVLKGWEGLYPKIKGWFTAMCDLPSCQKAVTLVITNGDTASLKESLLSQPAPLPLPHLKNVEKLEKLKLDDKVKVKVEKAAEPEEIQVISQKAVTKEELSAAVDAWNSGKSKCPKPLKRKHPILPKEGERNILITSALPYVNNVPHLGNIIGCVLSADVFSRYCRLRGYNCLYVCGTDEYGTATETKAIEEKLTPQQICDKYNKLHTEIYDWFNIDCDFFGRTTTKEQTSIAQDIFWKLYNQGYILKDSIDQLHCTACDRFLADRFVEGTCPLCTYEDARGDQCDKCGKLINAVDLGNPKCKLCKATPVIKSTQHLFLDLPKIEPQLQKHLDKVFKSGTWTNNAKVITSSWIRDGLKPRCISRDLKWGTQVPLSGYTDKVFYVWFDAPIGYISITANYTEHWEQWWKNPDKVDMYNFLGKDNVPFHSVIFPCTMLGANDNYTVVKHMIATEYLNYEDGKFSKSRGTGVFGNQAQDTGLPADIFRFYLLYVRPESQDSSFSWDDFLLKNNSELLNNLGNFINRGLKFLSDNFGGVIQEMNLRDEDKELLALINRELQTYIDNMEQAILRDSIRNIMSISRLGNQFMQSNKPWVLVKGSADDKSRSGTVVSLAVNIANLLSVLLQPYMPETSQTIQTQLNTPPDSNVVYREFVCHLPPGHKIGKPSPLFQKIEACKIEEFKKMFAGQPAPETKPKRGEKTAVFGPVNTAEVQRLTDEVTKQGLVVRDLKSKKAEKSLIDSEVAKLLDLKKSLAAVSVPASNGPGNNAEVERLTDEVTKQGLVVRDLKSKKAEKSLIDSEVAKLLDLKKSLAAVSVPASNGPGNNAEVERLTDEVTKQGLVVRDLKSKKAEKSLIDSEVAKLLDLKKRLALAGGQNPQEAAGGGKKKGKKK